MKSKRGSLRGAIGVFQSGTGQPDFRIGHHEVCQRANRIGTDDGVRIQQQNKIRLVTASDRGTNCPIVAVSESAVPLIRLRDT